MRNVVLGVGISLDGYIARPDGAVDFLFMPKDYSMAPFMKTIDVCIMGRKTYDDALKMGGFGNYQTTPFYIMSRTLPARREANLTITHQSPAELVAELRKSDGKNIWLMGGGELARSFLQDDLVDELYLGIVPVIIGAGRPLFPTRFPQREFTLVENKTFSQGMIALRYARTRNQNVSKSSGSKSQKSKPKPQKSELQPKKRKR